LKAKILKLDKQLEFKRMFVAIDYTGDKIKLIFEGVEAYVIHKSLLNAGFIKPK